MMTTSAPRDRASQLKLRRMLTRAWQPFFGRFGGLTEIQARAIPAVLAGHNVVVTAPTASGKTEAVVGPVAELQLQQGWPGLGVIYLVPTRALGNDLILRLEGPLSMLSLRAVLKHGDQPVLPTGEIHWLLTTPESLDSLLCRRPAFLQNVRTVIVDEIHLLDGTYRGDQVRVLLARLARGVAAPLAIHLLSATLPNPEAVAQRYVADYQVIQATGARSVEVHFAQSHADVLQLVRARRWHKVLYFCNTRKAVEETARALQELWAPYPVVAHHGSLDRGQREDAETVMKQNRAGACVATMSLEIGIDIGDIDLVVLADPPWSLESLQQRIGRGSRRAGTIQAVALYRTEDERELLTQMFEAAAQGRYHTTPYRPDRSVIVQQFFSLFYGAPTGLPRTDVVDLLGRLGTPAEVNAILAYLIEKGYLLRRGDRLYPTPELLDLGERGEIHSNVPNSGDYAVVDAASGHTVGRIRGTFDQVFLLAGQSWQVLAVRGNEVIARRQPRGVGAAAFGRQRNLGRFHSLLPPELRTPSAEDSPGANTWPGG